VRPSTVLRPGVSPTSGLRLERLVEVLGVNSRLDSLKSTLWYSSTIRPEANLRYPYYCIKSGGDLSRPATEPTGHGAPSKEDTATGAKTHLSVSPLNFRGHLSLGGSMSSHNDSFAASGSSPTDFRCENHGSIFLLYPLTHSAQSWIEENLPSDAQWVGHSVVVEHRYIWAILEGIQNDGLVVQSS